MTQYCYLVDTMEVSLDEKREGSSAITLPLPEFRETFAFLCDCMKRLIIIIFDFIFLPSLSGSFILLLASTIP